MKHKQELRFLITNNCNYVCQFCHLEGMEKKKISTDKLLSAEDYAFMFEAFKAETGCDTVTLTGGEPFLRVDITKILSALHDRGAKITIVTNGSLLPKNSEKKHGLDVYRYVNRLNISLHTLVPEEYSRITGRDALNSVLTNIVFVKENYPNVDIRLNVVAVRPNCEIIDLIRWSGQHRVSIKFIELYPTTCDGFKPITDIEDLSLSVQPKACLEYQGKRQKAFDVDGRKIVFTRISCSQASTQQDMTPQQYCQKNTDIFITPDGNIKTCMNTYEIIPAAEVVKSRNDNKFIDLTREAISKFGEGCNLSR